MKRYMIKLEKRLNVCRIKVKESTVILNIKEFKIRIMTNCHFVVISYARK